jgi:hypothetical protein
MAAVGEWRMVFSVRDLYKPKVAHAEAEVIAVLATFLLMRRRRGEPCPKAGETCITTNLPRESTDLMALKGHSAFDKDATLAMLDELSLCLGACLGQRIVDYYVPSLGTPNRPLHRRYTIRRSS